MGKFTRFIVLVPVLFAVTLDASVEAKTCNLKIDGTRDYRDVDDKRISWNAILEVGISEYLVFVYSPYCGHCLEIKDVVINYAFCGENEMRFVAANQDVKLGNDIEATLGATTIEQVWIIGYPSLLNIKDEVLVMNIGGSTAIVDYLMDVPNGI